ncbi:MAG: hypothetical protein OEY36_07575 [Gammaproteobacteria bacterium]|nr:hypothetical protein [Gammaproteobacteria bacterium]
MVARLLVIALLWFNHTAVQAQAADNNTMSVTFYQSQIEVSQSEINLWQREMLTLRVDCVSTEEFSYLKTQTHHNYDSISESRILNTTINKEGYFVKTLLLYIWPLKSGEQQLTLPPVQLMLSNRVIKTLAVTKLALNVRPLPAYLPPGFPVGKISIDDTYQSVSILPFLLKPGELFNYQLEIHSKGLHASLLPHYPDYLSSPDFQRLPVSQTIEKQSDDVFYALDKIYQMPALISSSGAWQLDAFKILYFDPLTGKIISRQFKSAFMLTLHPLLQFLAAIIVLIVSTKLLLQIKRLIKRFYYRRRLWRQIYHSNNASELATAVSQLAFKSALFSSEPELLRHRNLSQWAHSWNDPSLLLMAGLINKHRYSNTDNSDFTELKMQLIKALKSADKWPFFSFITVPS